MEKRMWTPPAKEPPSLQQTVGKSLEGPAGFVVRCLLCDYRIMDKHCAIVHASLSPGAHPFAISPAIGSEQSHRLSLQSCLYRAEGGFERVLLEDLLTHRRTAERFSEAMTTSAIAPVFPVREM